MGSIIVHQRQEPLQAGTAVVRSLTLQTVRQEQHNSGLLAPPFLPCCAAVVGTMLYACAMWADTRCSDLAVPLSYVCVDHQQQDFSVGCAALMLRSQASAAACQPMAL